MERAVKGAVKEAERAAVEEDARSMLKQVVKGAERETTKEWGAGIDAGREDGLFLRHR